MVVEEKRIMTIEFVWLHMLIKRKVNREIKEFTDWKKGNYSIDYTYRKTFGLKYRYQLLLKY